MIWQHLSTVEILSNQSNSFQPVKEVDSNLHECLWGEEVTAGVVETARELELIVEPEDVIEIVKSHDTTITNEELLLMDDKESGFLRWNVLLVKKL